MDRLLTDYRLYAAYRDAATSKHIELGVNDTLGSVDFQVVAYDRPYKERWRLETGVTLFSSLARTDNIALEFDGSCYLIIYDDIKEVFDFVPEWTDPESGGKVCLRIVSFNRRDVISTPIHRNVSD